MSVIQTSSSARDLGVKAPHVGNFLVAEAPDGCVDAPGASPARGMVIALGISALAWAGIVALIF